MPAITVPPTSYRPSVQHPAEVQEDLCRLWHDNLHPSTSPEWRFQWLYRDAPHANSTVVVIEAIEGDVARVVGANGMVPRPFWLAGREVAAAVSCDFAVDRAHRSLLPALTLLRALRAHLKERVAFVYGFPNAKAEAVLKRAGFKEVGRATRWVKVLRYAHYAERVQDSDSPFASRLIQSNRGAARALLTIFDAIRAAWHGLRHAPRLRDLEVTAAPAPDERWDALWLQARRDYEVVGERTAAFLRWRSAVVPGVLFVTLQRRDNQQLRAYAMVQIDETTGAAHVRDLFGYRADLARLITHLIPFAYRAGASSVSMRFLGAPDVERHLIAAGFVQREGTRSVVIDLGPDLEGGPAADPRAWHLFDVDEDS